MACLVSKGENVIKGFCIVHKDIRLCAGASGAESAASLTLCRINVNPAALGKTCFKCAVILLAEDLRSLDNLLNCFLIRILLIKLADKGSIKVIHVKLINAKNLTLEIVVVIKRRKSLVYGLNKIIINGRIYLVTMSGGGNGILEVTHLCHSAFLFNMACKEGCKCIAKLLVGLIESAECRLANTAILAHKHCNVASVLNLYLVAIFILNLAKL